MEASIQGIPVETPLENPVENPVEEPEIQENAAPETLEEALRSKASRTQVVKDIGNTEVLQQPIKDAQKIIYPPPYTVRLDDENKEPNVPGSILLDEHGKILKKYITLEGVGGFIVSAFNTWLNDELPALISSANIPLADQSLIKFTDITYLKPYYRRNGESTRLLPVDARVMKSVAYNFDIYVHMTRYKGNSQNTKISGKNNVIAYNMENVPGVPPEDLIVERTQSQIFLASLPCMIGSELCWTYNKTDEEKIQMGEDPRDIPAYFIGKSGE